MEHPIHSLMKISMENIKGMIDVDTIIGQKIETESGVSIIPVSKVGFGYVAGGTEFEAIKKDEADHPFGGGSSGGVSITPIAFLVVNGDKISLLHIKEDVHLYEKLIDLVPNLVDKFKKTGNAMENESVK